MGSFKIQAYLIIDSTRFQFAFLPWIQYSVLLPVEHSEVGGDQRYPDV